MRKPLGEHQPDQPLLFAEPARGMTPPAPVPAAEMPLAARMRPRRLDEFVGQEHLVGPGCSLRRMVEAGTLGSMILWGPPGTGKTTLALLLASASGAHFASLHAVTEGVAELRRVIEEARARRRAGQRTVLLVDEVHRWSKAQQDALLPHIEQGLLILIGATTENPYFDVIAPLRSRLRIFRLEPLTDDHIRTIIERALGDEERGLGHLRLSVEPQAMELLVAAAGGDARVALTALEAAVTLAGGALGAVITVAHVQEATQRRMLRYDRAGDDHFQTISAFIKSVRGSDPDAAMLWLVKMLRAGEDPRFIARRLVILASEDIGNADPQALPLAVAAYEAVERIGLPEAEYALAQATLYLATAPKSNSAARALAAAKQLIESGISLEVPLHLRNASFRGAHALGYGVDYEYSHQFAEDDPQRYRQRYFPDGVAPVPLYEPGTSGYEATIRERLEQFRRWRNG
jgi:putative ATPase